MPTLSITLREIAPQPVLFIRRCVARAEIAQTLGECFGKLAAHCQASSVSMSGRPLLWTFSAGPSLMEIGAGFPIAQAAPGSGEIEAGTLPRGSTAVGVHGGAYDQLPESYTEVERWIESQDLTARSAPWESYLTDPAEHPNPEDWRTEIYWPVRS